MAVYSHCQASANTFLRTEKDLELTDCIQMMRKCPLLLEKYPVTSVHMKKAPLTVHVRLQVLL